MSTRSRLEYMQDTPQYYVSGEVYYFVFTRMGFVHIATYRYEYSCTRGRRKCDGAHRFTEVVPMLSEHHRIPMQVNCGTEKEARTLFFNEHDLVLKLLEIRRGGRVK